MKVDNFKLIEEILFKGFPEEVSNKSDMVVLGRIIRRRKENPEDERGDYIVKR